MSGQIVRLAAPGQLLRLAGRPGQLIRPLNHRPLVLKQPITSQQQQQQRPIILQPKQLQQPQKQPVIVNNKTMEIKEQGRNYCTFLDYSKEVS